MAPRLEGRGQTAWSGFHALKVEVRYGIDFNGFLNEGLPGTLALSAQFIGSSQDRDEVRLASSSKW